MHHIELDKQMTAEQFRRALERLELSNVKAGQALGIDPRTIRRYTAGEAAVPRTVELAVKHLLSEAKK